jgi:predicted nucleotidyltransferase
VPATCLDAIDRLAAVNRPRQFTIMENVTDLLAASPAVTHLLVRGSFARGTSDRLSDVDLVVGIDPEAYIEFVTTHDALSATQLGAIMPGWFDTIVPRMGGLGYVHLIEHDGKLYQLDLYLAPSDQIPHIAAFTRGQVIYTAPHAADTIPDPDAAVARFITDRLTAPPTCEQLIIEALALSWMIHKRIVRGQRFMAYAETHMLHTAARTLVRTALSPQTAFYGWYHLDTDLGATPIGRACLRELDALITSPPLPTHESLTGTLERILALAHRAAPHAVEGLRLSIDAYRYHLDLG